MKLQLKMFLLVMFIIGMILLPGCDMPGDGGGDDGDNDGGNPNITSVITIENPNQTLWTGGFGKVRLRLNPAPAYDLFVYYTISGPVSSTNTQIQRIGAGATTYDININPDNANAGDIIEVTLLESEDTSTDPNNSDNNYVLGNPSSATIVLTDEAPPIAHIDGEETITIIQPTMTYQCIVKLDKAPSSPMNLDFRVTPLTANEGSDYNVITSYPLIFNTDDEQLEIEIELYPSIYEPDGNIYKSIIVELIEDDIFMHNQDNYVRVWFEPADEPIIVYGIDHNTDELVIIDVTHHTDEVITSIGSLGIDVDETATMDYDPTNSRIVLCSGHAFYEITIEPFNVTLINEITQLYDIDTETRSLIDINFTGITYDSDGFLYGYTSEGAEGKLYSIALEAGDCTLMGSNTVSTGTGIEIDYSDVMWLSDKDTEKMHHITIETGAIAWTSDTKVYYAAKDLWDIDCDSVGNIWIAGSEPAQGLHSLIQLNSEGTFLKVYTYYDEKIKAIVTIP